MSWLRIGGLLLGVTTIAKCVPQAGMDELPESTTFPHVVVGALEVSVEEGPVGEDDISEINFGGLSVDGNTFMVSLAGDVVREAGIERNDLFGGATYRVTLSGIDQLSGSIGVIYYQVSKIEQPD